LLDELESKDRAAQLERLARQRDYQRRKLQEKIKEDYKRLVSVLEQKERRKAELADLKGGVRAQPRKLPNNDLDNMFPESPRRSPREPPRVSPRGASRTRSSSKAPRTPSKGPHQRSHSVSRSGGVGLVKRAEMEDQLKKKPTPQRSKSVGVSRRPPRLSEAGTSAFASNAAMQRLAEEARSSATATSTATATTACVSNAYLEWY
jgi:hypothetical protein